MDTSELEKRGEDYLSSALNRKELLIAKPKFDKNGTDLLGLVSVEDGARFCRIQCKSRTINSGRSSVVVPVRYVSTTFIVCLYLEVGESCKPTMFMFFGPEIEALWTRGERKEGEVYRLEITLRNIEEEWSAYLMSEVRVRSLISMIERASVKGEFQFVSGATGQVVFPGTRVRGVIRDAGQPPERSG